MDAFPEHSVLSAAAGEPVVSAHGAGRDERSESPAETLWVVADASPSQPFADEEGDGWASLPVELLTRILARLPLSDRAAAAWACSGWRAAAASPALWTALSFADSAPSAAACLDDAAFAQLAARARGRLVRLDASALPRVSPDALVAAARASASTLEELRASEEAPLWSAAHVLQLAACCRACRLLEVGTALDSLDACAALLALLPRGVRMPRLELRGLALSAEDAAALGASLRRYAPLKALSLAGCRLGDAPTGMLLGALRGHPALEALNLSACAIGPGGATAVAAALQHDALALRALRMSDNGVFAEGARALGIALRRNRSLASLTLASCGLGLAGARSIAGALRHNRALRVLDLNGNRLTDAGAAAVAEAVAAGAAGAARHAAAARAAMAATASADAAERGALPAMPPAPPAVAALTTLRLRHNGISDAGCAALASALRCNPPPPLQELDLRLNAARAPGVEALAAALSGNDVVTKVLLSGNALEAETALKIDAACGDGRLQLWEPGWVPAPRAAGTRVGGLGIESEAHAMAAAEAPAWAHGWWAAGAGGLDAAAVPGGGAAAAAATATAQRNSRQRVMSVLRAVLAAIALALGAFFAAAAYRRWIL